MAKSLFAIFPSFRDISDEEWESAKPQIREFQAKATLFRRDDAASYCMFLLSGTVLISSLDAGGREAVSNRLRPGDVCAMMVLCGLSEREYPGTITAETEGEALFVEKRSFLRWIHEYPSIRQVVFGNILDGLIQLGSQLSDKLSQPLDSRLAGALLKRTSEQLPSVRTTHQQLAVELGSAREVVSRILGRMKQRGWIATERGIITVLQRKALAELVGD
ncbi:Crp/Fnr family transcriptional regulator [Brevibacillus choshinensis]|uniref:Crp/Fnr family transcriptional regulator n=1 Tax=Brevibacillus choshinensis TaxID=54911 RepID=A0ABX7FR31_BRECH|nr:Crp/Fnr family transcriptional regulator [Brevibacillus choshinensis]QRG68713.1 Crp/Fnr family transcriptional regulator [Brevibacillus choshinensis]